MKVLVVVAHPDDEVLGCGGTIAKYSKNGYKVNIVIVAEGLTSRDNERNLNKRLLQLNSLKKQSKESSQILGANSIEFLNLPDNRLDSLDLIEIVKKIEKIVFKFKPQEIFTHHHGDLNIDHRIVHQAVMTAARPHSADFVKKIITFENPSSTEFQSLSFNSYFKPNYFQNIENFLPLKIKALKKYKSEIRQWPHSRSTKFLEILAKYRGSISGLKFAEAFFIERFIN